MDRNSIKLLFFSVSIIIHVNAKRVSKSSSQMTCYVYIERTNALPEITSFTRKRREKQNLLDSKIIIKKLS